MAELQEDSSRLRAQRACGDFQRGNAVLLRDADKDHTALCLPAEYATRILLSNFLGLGKAKLLITSDRMTSLGLSDRQAVSFDAGNWTAEQCRAFARSQQNQLPGKVDFEPANALEQAALTLAQYAQLLPTLLCVHITKEQCELLSQQGYTTIDIADITRLALPDELEVIEEIDLPLEVERHTRAVLFRSRYGSGSHMALVLAKQLPDVPLVRLHSSCFTGDLLGSLRCDCGSQLREALARIAASGGGILLYLNQEGRGIGLANKIHAYALQDQGADTAQANQALGFAPDARDFSIAAIMLKKLGITKLKLLTNNPRKAKTLEDHGLKVVERLPLIIPATEHTEQYLATKASKLGHLF